MKVIPFIAAGLLAFACGTKKNAETGEVMPDKNKTTPVTKEVVKVTAAIGDFAKSSDAIQIDTVEVRGNILYIDVTYSGGCEEHDFEVIGSPMIAKSMPPIRAIQLVHHANGDTCREQKSIKLEVYIDELAYQKEVGSEIYLNLEGWKERIYYKYALSN